MKSFSIYLLVACAILCSCSKEKKESGTISIGTIDSVHSDILNETRKIWIYTPPSADDKTTDKVKYPVLYLLDGDSHFHSVTGLLHQLTMNNNVPPMIVVAILNTDRTRDLTP